MNIVNSGETFRVYGEDVKTFKELPVATYKIGFSIMGGFYLTLHDDLETREEKIYGNTNNKVKKALDSFKDANRNFGIILSGPKGSGKSLFTRALSESAAEQDIPTIIADMYIDGLEDFISSIKQEVLIIFDEFEKKFSENNAQQRLLSLFDGIDAGKKMFVITCNEIGRLNQYLLNRPGRFHYHFVTSAPSAVEIKEYMTDKLLPQYHDQIDNIVSLAMGAEFTYDCLRAIVTELNKGYSVQETFEDLNIRQENEINMFEVSVITNHGERYSRKYKLNIYDNNEMYMSFGENYNRFEMAFEPANMQYDYTHDVFVLTKFTYIPNWTREDFEEMEDDKPKNEVIEKALTREPLVMHFKRIKNNNGRFTFPYALGA